MKRRACLALASALALVVYSADKLRADEPPAASRAAQLRAEAAQLDAAGKLAESLALRKEIAELTSQAHGADSVEVAQALAELAHNYRRLEKFADAETPARQALAIGLKKVGEKDLLTINTYGQLVDILNHAKKFKEAEPLARKLLALRQEVLGGDHAETADAMCMLGGSLFFLDQGAEAATLSQRAHEIYLSRFGPDDERTRRADQGCADCLNVAVRVLFTAAEKKYPNDVLAAQYETFQGMQDVLQRVFPPERYPNGHRRTARTLMQLGVVRAAQGRPAEARPHFEQALAMQEKLLLPKYPEGHPELVETHSRLSETLHAHGEYEEATKHARAALQLARGSFPPGDYPEGHALFARALVNLGFMIGGGPEGRKLYEEALVMQRKLYPVQKFPRGHPDIVATLYNLGNVLIGQNDARGAAERLREAYEMSVRLDDRPSFGQMISLQYLGRLYDRADLPDEAERCFAGASDLQSRLYPAELFPQGHSDIAFFQAEFAGFLHRRGKPREASLKFAAAESMRHALATAHLASVSEAEALNFSLMHLHSRDFLLSAWHATDRPDAELYEHLWRSRGLIHRTLALRRTAVIETDSADVKRLLTAYQESRQKLAQAAFVPAGQSNQPQVIAQRLTELTAQKESLERQLAEAVPDFRAKLIAREPPPHTRLAERLPAGTAFVDFVQYLYEPPGKPGPRPASPRLAAVDEPTLCYAAFVLSQGAAVRRIDLGPAKPIDETVDRWRKEIAADLAGTASNELRDLVWKPIEERFASGVQTVYLVPDGRLSSLPWAALPGPQRGTVLLEQYALATVPYGQFLLERRGRAAAAETTHVLAVGEVDFGTSGDAARDTWPRLPGTRLELAEVAAAAGNDATVVRGGEATTARILRELPAADVAHLATHGFFADAELRSFLQLDRTAFAQRDPSVSLRTSVADRSPLLLSGLVLAGANESQPGELPLKGSGIMTAEAIAGLPLARLRLAVLSACDTGLGDVAGGEGVFGLQRAFHQAGTQNVVASLWKVNDEATTALMRLFYHHLWEENLPPLEALRKAQLALYRRPDQTTALATTTRGPNFNKIVKLVEGGAVPSNTAHSPPRIWAAFTLSGAGQ